MHWFIQSVMREMILYPTSFTNAYKGYETMLLLYMSHANKRIWHRSSMFGLLCLNKSAEKSFLPPFSVGKKGYLSSFVDSSKVS